MSYCALLIPQDVNKDVAKNETFFEDIKGKLLSGVKSGGLSFSNASTVLKNTASLLTEGVDTIGNKFSGIALTQLLTNGKISNDTAFNYLTQGFPKALGMTSVAMGFQSVEQLKTALRSENGVNVQQFISSFQNFGNALSDLIGKDKIRANVEGFDVIEIDAVTNDSRSYQAETPDRRVESGQSYQEYIHNMPDILTLECYLQDGRRYSNDEFEDILTNLRERKIAIDVILGDTRKESFVLTNFTPYREPMGGYQYSLELKKIQVGQISIVNLQNALKKKTDVIKNKLNPQDTKTEKEEDMGYWGAIKEVVSLVGD